MPPSGPADIVIYATTAKQFAVKANGVDTSWLGVAVSGVRYQVTIQ